MGFAASGRIAYGVDYGEENPLWRFDEYGDILETTEDREELIDLVLERVEDDVPPDPFEDPRYLEWYQENQSKPWKERQDFHQWQRSCGWWEPMRRVYREHQEGLEATIPLEIATYGDVQHFSCYTMVLKGVGFDAYDYCQEFDIGVLAITQEQIDAAVEFCERYDLAWESPTWLLMASYG